ncbi:MAG: hypothetical protein RL659_1963 [Pseudomonadota bacterium]
MALHGFSCGWFDWASENSAGRTFLKRHCFFFDRHLVHAPVDQSSLVAIKRMANPQKVLAHVSYAENSVTIDRCRVSICDIHQIVIKLKFIGSIIL